MNINKSENMDASCICIFPVCRMKIENCELNALISIKICFSGSRLTDFGETENLKKMHNLSYPVPQPFYAVCKLVN